MSLELVEWIDKLADARTKSEIVDVMLHMPAVQMLKYQDNISKRLMLRGFPEAADYMRLGVSGLYQERSTAEYDAIWTKFNEARARMIAIGDADEKAKSESL